MLMVETRLDEDELIRSCIAGEESAFTQLVEDHQDMVLSIARRLGAGKEQAEDIAQEVFLRVYRNLDKFSGKSKLSTWIYRIAYNTTVELWRRRKETISFDFLLEEGWQPESYDQSPDESTERVEQMRLLQGLIGNLPEKYRGVIVLFYLQDKSYEQVAEIMSLPLGTVKTYLHRAKKALYTAYVRREGGGQ
jgi:RNA polymerase sigma-70 factor (ECF subfamily)